MPLHFADSVLYNCMNFRVVHLWGRFGSGKTALAWYLAYEMMLKFKFRYILSNIKSAWADKVEDVVLRDGMKADAILVLDEAGAFMKTSSETSQWLGALRKMNIVILCPSFEPPSRSARMLTFQRVFNGRIIGLNFWWYKWNLSMGEVNETGNFYWRNPSEVFGIFDTGGYPVEADAILSGVQKWIATARYNSGYASKIETAGIKTEIDYVAPEDLRRLPSPGTGNVAANTGSASVAHMVDVERAADALTEATRKLEKAIPVRMGRKGR